MSRLRLPASLRAGIRASLPLLVGIVPFGLIAGVAAVDAGLSPVAALGMSVVVFAGASQLAVIDLLRSDTSLVVVVVTGVIINLRMLMYSASIAPYFQRYRARWKATLAYFLTDQAYAVAISRYERTDAERAEAVEGERQEATASESASTTAASGATGERRDLYYLGVAATIWVVWVVSTIVGIGLGRGVPDSWGLEFAVPLVFLALLVPRLKDVPSAVAGGVGGLVAVLGAGLPYELGLPLAALVGVGAGVVVGEGRDE